MSVLTRYPVPQPVAEDGERGTRLYFRLEPTIVPDPVLQFLRPLRGLEVVGTGVVDDPRLYFRLPGPVAAAGPRGPLGHPLWGPLAGPIAG